MVKLYAVWLQYKDYQNGGIRTVFNIFKDFKAAKPYIESYHKKWCFEEYKKNITQEEVCNSNSDNDNSDSDNSDKKITCCIKIKKILKSKEKYQQIDMMIDDESYIYTTIIDIDLKDKHVLEQRLNSFC